MAGIAQMEDLLERLLWGSRRMVLVAVAASILMALAALLMATIDVGHLLARVAVYARADPSTAQTAALNSKIITTLVKAVDGYLFMAILLIFGIGLYELFIGKLEVAERSEVGVEVLRIRTLDDLKDRLAKVVILILVITFFQQAVEMKYETPRDLLYLALGVLLVGGALYVSSKASKAHEPAAERVLGTGQESQ